MNFCDENEKNDFLKSDGTEKNTSSENERDATYAGTKSMYDEPKKNTIVSYMKIMIRGYIILHVTHQHQIPYKKICT